MTKINVVAIDGPAGSGKSTVAKKVAKRLGFLYIDTGAMYRALTLDAINKKLDLNDDDELIKLSQNVDIKLQNTGDNLKVFLRDDDVSEKIRTMEVTTQVKHVASVKGVRENMVKLQRKLSKTSKGSVLEGRDIGTVVFPDAKYKIYLDAGFDTRVKRRFDELKEKGYDVPIDEVKNDVSARDNADMTRQVGPLKKADDAEVIDTTDMTIEEVTEKILSFVK